MNVRHLQLLRELADRGSITAVAAATHRTPSAISQQLRTAQRGFGTALVEPAGRGLRLTTDAGRLLADGAIEVDTAFERTRARWEEFRNGLGGTVTIASCSPANPSTSRCRPATASPRTPRSPQPMWSVLLPAQPYDMP